MRDALLYAVFWLCITQWITGNIIYAIVSAILAFVVICHLQEPEDRARINRKTRR